MNRGGEGVTGGENVLHGGGGTAMSRALLRLVLDWHAYCNAYKSQQLLLSFAIYNELYESPSPASHPAAWSVLMCSDIATIWRTGGHCNCA